MTPSRAPLDEYFTFGFASGRSKASRFDSFHRHNEVELGFVERGAVSVLFSSGTIVFDAGVFHVFWGAMPHRNMEMTPGAQLHWLTIPLAWFLEWKLPGPLTGQLLEGAVLIDANKKRAASDLQQFTQWHADLKTNSADARKLVLLEAEARVRRMQSEPARPLAKPSAARRADRGASGSMGKVEQMAAHIAAHYREELRVPAIAASAGLHPDYAVTLFRKTCGMGLVDYITQHRVSHAQRLLATTEKKVLDIAFESGFGSASRFYAAFEQLCRQSPKEYRAETAGKRRG